MTGYCDNHPTVEAKHTCTQCGTPWCGACAAPVGATARVMCPKCGHSLEKARVARGGGEIAMRSIRRAISTEGLITAAAFAVFHAIASVGFGALELLYLSALVGFYFTIVHHVGDGKDGLPGPSDATDGWLEALGFVIRGVACIALGLAPLIAVVASGHVISPGVALLLVVAGQLYMPAMILAYAFTNNSLAIVWPVVWVRVIARAPGAYLRFAGLWLASCVVGVALAGVILAVSSGFVGALAAAFVWNLFWFAQASLVGEFIHANGAAFGWD